MAGRRLDVVAAAAGGRAVCHGQNRADAPPLPPGGRARRARPVRSGTCPPGRLGASRSLPGAHRPPAGDISCALVVVPSVTVSTDRQVHFG